MVDLSLLTTLVNVALLIMSIFFSMKICAHKGIPVVWGVVLGLFCCLFGIAIAALLPPAAKGKQLGELKHQIAREEHLDRQTTACPNCGRVISIRTPVCPDCETRLRPY